MSANRSKPKGKSMFRKFWLDVILGTLFVFGFMFGVGQFTGAKIFDVFDPIGQAFGDMEMTDVAFSHLQERPVVDTNFVMVNIANRSRFEIGMMLDSISQHDPAVIGMDTFFYFPHEDDSLGDQVLAGALSRVDNLVMASKWITDDNPDTADSLLYSWPTFMPEGTETAIVNLETGAAVQEDLKMCRNFPTKALIDGETADWAFGVKLASYLAPEKAKNFIARGNDLEVVNYRGNIMDFGATKFGNMFYALDDIDVMNGNYIPDLIKGKIVIFCFMGKHLADREALEDKFFTPLNKKYTGRAFPDMYGGVIHANIASMILNEDYINTLTDTQTYLVTLFIALLNIIAFSWIYKKIPRWYDGTTKLIQAIEFLALVFAMIWTLEIFSLKLDLTILLIFVALAGDLLEVYYGVVKNIFTRQGRKELFRVSKI